MINTNVVLDKSHLLAFLVKPSIGFAEHYVSSQPLSLYIPYTSYISLVKDLIALNLNILRTPINIYRNAIEVGENSLPMLRLYHYDIAASGLEEIYRSYRRGFQCTRIFSLVDCYSNLETKTIRFDSSAEFIQANFTQSERQELHKAIHDFRNIPMRILTEQKELISNVYMYYMCMAFFGVFKLRKNFIITVKEE